MASIEEVEKFLADFKVKLSIWGVSFRNERKKNLETIIHFEIDLLQREQTLKELSFLDYTEGPKTDTMNYYKELWVFGVRVKSREFYIKISMGIENGPVSCISFHVAEYPLRYPFK